MATVFLGIVCGLVIGFFIGLTGIGGGVLVMPALTLLLKQDTSVAVGTASLYALITKIYAIYEHYKLKTIDFGISLFFLIGAVPGNIAASLLINAYIAKNEGQTAVIDAFQHNLKMFIAWVLLFSVIMIIVQMLKKKPATTAETRDGPRGLAGISTGKRVMGIIFGVIIGALIGSTSVGGGVLIIPLLIIFFGLSTEKTVGTSIFIAVVLVLSTSIIYSSGGQINYRLALIMAVSSFAGVFVGSRLSVKMPEKILKGIVSTIIFIATLLMFFTSGGGH